MYFTAMNILIRLPNWLGDMVMSSAFVRAVQEQYPGATVDLVAKKGIEVLLDLFPPHGERYVFSKEEYKGLGGAWRFGKLVAKRKKYDLFFCLPDSFSSAVMGFATGAKRRIGYRKEARGFLLTSCFSKRKDLHRAEEYVDLLQQFAGNIMASPVVQLSGTGTQKGNAVIININSEAFSRRLPEEKAVRIIEAVREKITNELILVGAKTEKKFVETVFSKLKNKQQIQNRAGETDLGQLSDLFSNAALVLSTDSGPAHLANALGTHTLVLFGAGEERKTAPYNKANRTVIRLGKLSCEPCVSNTCKKYSLPECLVRLDEAVIVKEVQDALKRLTSAQ